MEGIIRQLVINLGFTTVDMIEDTNTSDRVVISIYNHEDDLSFIFEHITSNIDILITFDERTINIATRGNRDEEINSLATILAERFNMQITGNIDTVNLRSDFPFRVITLMRNLN